MNSDELRHRNHRKETKWQQKTEKQKDGKTKKQNGKKKHQTEYHKNTKNTKITESTGIDVTYISMTAKTVIVCY